MRFPGGSPREVWTFEGERFTFTRDAYTVSIVVGGAGTAGVSGSAQTPRVEARGTFRLIGTKTPRVVVLTFDEPKGLAPVETTYDLPDSDTFSYQEGVGFGKRCFRTYKRDGHTHD
jgi:hypothetical protein